MLIRIMQYTVTLLLISFTTVVAERQIIGNVNIVAIEDQEILRNYAVIIDNGVIQKVTPAELLQQDVNATFIDGMGGYLTPGLIDAHIHHYEGVPQINYVANGVTTVIGLGQRNYAKEFLKLREDALAKKIVAPRIYTTGKTVSSHITINDPTEATAYVKNLKTEGYDLVKVYNQIPQSVFDAVVAEAKHSKLPVFGHLPRTFPVEYSLTHGLDVVAHAEEFYFASFGGPTDLELNNFDGSKIPTLDDIDRLIKLMVTNDVALIPNIVFTFVTMRFWDDEEAAMADPEMAYWPDFVHDAWRKTNGANRDSIDKRMLRDRIKYNFIHEFTRRAHKAGVLIVTGTDAPERGVMSGASVHSEMRELVKSGLSYQASLAAATVNGGLLVSKYIDSSARIGIISPGYEADLIVVKQNPLEDIRNMKDIIGVMLDGQWMNRKTLNELRAVENGIDKLTPQNP